MIGASIGLALRDAGWTVAGWDPDTDALLEAESAGAITQRLPGPDLGKGASDIVFLCGPVEATVATLRQMTTDSTVTDVSSVKAPVIEAGRHLPNFVGGHPMAGSSASGARFASSHLFHGASWILCNDTSRPATFDELCRVIASMGANPIVLSAADHDNYVATVSHLPRVLASALIELVSRTPQATQLGAGSFRDLTRVAGSGTDWWSDVLAHNRLSVSAAIEGLIDVLGQWKAELLNNHREEIASRLEAARLGRSDFGAPVAEVRVVLFDRPGEVGRVGVALSESEVDLRDIQLRHAEYGGGGILTLSINADQTGPLRAALRANGFELES